MSTPTETDPGAERWDQHVERLLPLGLLGIATTVALVVGGVTGSATGWLTSTPRLLAQVTIAVGLGLWLLARIDRPKTRLTYLVRSVAAFVLTALNPLFCIFAWIGYTDADEIFEGRSMWLAVGATAVTMAMGQSGGIPTGWGRAALLLALLLVNFGIAYAVGRVMLHRDRISEERLAAIDELSRVNASLEDALAENAALHKTVVAQARAAGVRQERERLALEIHDTIAQSLAGVVAQLQAAKGSDDPDDVRRRVGRATELAREALTDARRSVLDLHPAPLAGGCLGDALDALVSGWRSDHDAEATLVITGEPCDLHPEVEATLLRIAQEALANVAQHARAGRVGVTLTYDEAEVMLDVRDDGVGFDPVVAPHGSGFGLRGMRQRAERLAGALEVESRPGQGAAVSARVPALVRGTM